MSNRGSDLRQEAVEWAAAVRDLGAEALIALAARRFPGRIALASSFSAEDQVLLHLIARSRSPITVFTLDTGRLPEETHVMMARVRDHYGVNPQVYVPQAARIEALLAQDGPNGFYKSRQARLRCCEARKVEPLRRALRGLDAWICGLRRAQGPTREHLEPVTWDEANDLVKICPLAAWSDEQVWTFIREHQVPTHPLHDQGYPSIGCAPCTRAVAPGGDPRSGRWWWEAPEHKECGLHRRDSAESARPGQGAGTDE